MTTAKQSLRAELLRPSDTDEASCFIASIIRHSEWYDFLIYGTASALASSHEKAVFSFVQPVSAPSRPSRFPWSAYSPSSSLSLLLGHFGDTVARKAIAHDDRHHGLGTFLIGLLPHLRAVSSVTAPGPAGPAAPYFRAWGSAENGARC